MPSTNYPAALDNYTDPTAIQQTTSPSHSEIHGNVHAAIEAIETELGVAPSGASVTIVARLDAGDAALTAHTADTIAAHAASAVSFAPAGTIAATDAQTAIAEVATDAASALTTHADLALHASASGTSMPAQPGYGNNVPFFRTDLGLVFFYNGTRWLSVTLYDDESPPNVLPQPFAATTISHRGAVPQPGIFAVWMETFRAVFFVGAGTALDASNKWVVVFRSDPAATTLGTLNINSGASSTYRTLSVAVNAVSPITEFQTRVTATKTGTPGDLNIWPRYTYRLIAT